MKEDYPVYVAWMDATDWILSAVDRMPKAVRFSVSGRVANLALDVLEDIVEAIYTRERGPILRRANLHLEKLRVLFQLCHRRKYLSMKQYEHIAGAIDETGRMLGGWGKSS